MKKLLIAALLVFRLQDMSAQTEDWYGPVSISFHGFICNRPTNDDPLGMDGVGDETEVHFWTWGSVVNNRANFNGMTRIYGEDFFLPFRIKAGTSTINGGLKAGDSYYREGVYGDGNPAILGKYDIVNTFCSNNSVIVILPTIWERDEGPKFATPVQDFGVKARAALNDVDIQAALLNFATQYVYNDADPYGFMYAGRYFGLDEKFAGLFTADKNIRATRPVGLFANWDYSSQALVLTPKTIKILAEKDYGYGKGIIPVQFNEESMENTFGHGNYLLLLKVVADIKNRNANAAPVKNLSLGVKVASVAPGERFMFYCGSGPMITVMQSNTPVYFNTKFATGDSFHIQQISGSRTCFATPSSGVFSNTNIIVTADCGQLPTQQKLGVRINEIAEGEIFEFSAGVNKKIIVTEANKIYYFPGTFKTGDNWTVSQLSGPRSCQLFPNNGQIAHDDVVVSCDCGPAPVKSKLKGKLSAPKGTKVFLKNSLGDSISVLQSTGANGEWASTDFQFPKQYPVGEHYTATVRMTSDQLGCIVYENSEGEITREGTVLGVRCDRTYDLISRSSDDKILNTYYESFTPVIGGINEDEGRYVAFVAYGKGMDGSSGNFRQVFWRDRKLGITKLISRTPSNAEGNNNSVGPAISADGKTVAFESYATNLTGYDNNGVRDVYVWNENTGVSLVSRTAGGATSNGESYEPTISGNGNVIAFTSYASDIVPLKPVFSTPNVYVSNSQGGVDFITKDFETGRAAGGYSPSISADGNKVAFCAYTGHLVRGDNNNLWDIFLWENGNPVLKRISRTSSGGERNQGTESASRVVAPAISGNGRFIAYATTASNMVPGDNNNAQDIFLYDNASGSVNRISTGMNGESDGDSPIGQGEQVGISYDGTWISYATGSTNLGVIKGNIILQNTITGRIIPVTNRDNCSTSRPLLSNSGGYVVAGSNLQFDKRFASSGLFVFQVVK